jgi:hypothetical protein
VARPKAGRWDRKGGRVENKKAALKNKGGFFFGDPAGIRTQDPYIKSVLLYQLSYRIFLLSLQPRVISLNCDAKV